MNLESEAAAHIEPHHDTKAKLNWLRAAVLGANDGIVSIAALVVGVASATDSVSFIVTAGVAGMLGGALSMAVGEYVSVSTQRDTEKNLIEKERLELETAPEREIEELIQIYEGKGLSRETASRVANELTEKDAFAAHLDAELHIDPKNLTNPWHAGFASAASFFGGALLPLIAITVPPPDFRIPITFVSVLLALTITGALSAHVGNANKTRAIIRIVIGGAIGMALTFGIGKLFGIAGI